LQPVPGICQPSGNMPFTLAHPAAILPLRRFSFLQTVPLIIGSLVPDLGYFLPQRLYPLFADSHSAVGLFICDLPVGMALLVLTLLLRDPLTALLSARARFVCYRSIERFTERPLHWPIAILSLLVGAWTHLAWDSFTHAGGWTTLRVAALSAPVSVLGWNTELTRLLQYMSSLFGLVVLTVWFMRLVRAAPTRLCNDTGREGAQWFLLCLICIAALAIGSTRALMLWHQGSWYRLTFLMLTRVISWFALLYFTAGIAVMINRRMVPEPVA
jgi:hypothetical protein